MKLILRPHWRLRFCAGTAAMAQPGDNNRDRRAEQADRQAIARLRNQRTRETIGDGTKPLAPPGRLTPRKWPRLTARQIRVSKDAANAMGPARRSTSQHLSPLHLPPRSRLRVMHRPIQTGKDAAIAMRRMCG
jgi:hypothetical protein